MLHDAGHSPAPSGGRLPYLLVQTFYCSTFRNMIKKHIISFAAIAACCLCACTSSSEVIANHFDAMGQLVQQSPDDCEKIASSLDAYLNANEASMRSAVSNISGSETNEARKIFESSLALHLATEKCTSDSMEKFRTRLSDIVLQSTSK